MGNLSDENGDKEMTDLTAAHLALAESSWEDLCKLKYTGAVTKDEFVAMQRELIAKVCMLGFGQAPTMSASNVEVEGCYCTRCSENRDARRLAAKVVGGKI